MSDTQEKRPDSQTDSHGHTQEEGSAGVNVQEAVNSAVNERERLAALDELDAARKRLLAAQEQMNAAQARLNAIEHGFVPPLTHPEKEGLAPQGLADLAQKEDAKEEGPEAKEGIDLAKSKPDANAQALPHYGVMNGFFNAFAKMGPIAILIFLGCMAWPIFFPFANLNYCPAEMKPITAFLHMLATGNWFDPTGLSQGTWSAAQWPLFTWCIAFLGLIPWFGSSELLLPAIAFGCTFAALFAVWSLTIGTGFGGKSAMAAVIILLCAPIFAPMPHFIGPASLSAALMVFAILFFYRGWTGRAGWIELPLAFIFTAFAGLAGGILPFATPLIASICFLIWRGTFSRIYKLDAIFGFLLMACIIGVWYGLVKAYGQEAYLQNLFDNAFQFAMPIPLNWFLAIAAGIIGLMPWLLIIFGVSWTRVIAKSAQTLSASRHSNGSAMIWISLVISIVLSIFIPWFHSCAIIIACLMAVILGKAFMRMPNWGNCFFFLLASICLIIAGGIIIMASFPTSQNFLFKLLPELPVPDIGAKLLQLPTLPFMGGILLVGGLIALFFVKRCRGAGGLFYAMLLVIILCQPARLLLVPELAKMSGSPLVPYNTIKTQVLNVMMPTPVPDVIVEQPQMPAVTDPQVQGAEPIERGGVVMPEGERRLEQDQPVIIEEVEPKPAEDGVPNSAPAPESPAEGADTSR